MSDFYLDHYLFDNSKIYLQDGDKPPKGAIIHKGPKDGRYYDPDERPVQYVHISPERRNFLTWLGSQAEGFNIDTLSNFLENETIGKGYRDRFEIRKEVLALERIGLIYRDGDTYRISDEGKQITSQEGEIGVIDRVKREEQLKRSPFRAGIWGKQDLRGLSKYVNIPSFGLTEKYPPVFGDDLAEYTKFKTVGLVDHQPYIYYIMDEVIEHSYSDNEILKYCRDNSDRFDEIYTKEGRAYVMDEIRKAHDAIRLNKYDEVDLSSPVISALIHDRIIGKNDSERIVLTDAGEKALKDGKYEFSLPKTQIQQSITDETMLGIDKNKYPVSDYFIKTNTDITPAEMQSIIEYKFQWFDVINRALLNGAESIPEGVNNMIACLDNLLSRSVIKEPCTLYNGCPTEVSNMMLSGEFNPGDIVQLDTFTSTSLDSEVAREFSNNDVILQIEQPAGSTGFFFGTEETEQEVLLPRGTQLRIKEIRKVPRYHEFYGGLEEDGSLTWDTLTDEEKVKALDDGYYEMPTLERNFDTLSPEDQEMMGKTIVVCERISGINNTDQIQADNAAYKRYLKPGEPYPKGKTIHRGTRKSDARWYWADPDRKDPELYKNMVIRAKYNLTWKPYPGEEKYKTEAAEQVLINTIADICSTYDVEVPNVEIVPTIEHPVLKHLDYSGVYGIVDCESRPIYGPDPRDNSFVKVIGWMPPLPQGTIRLCTGSLKEGISPSQARYESDPDIQQTCVRMLSKDVAKDPLERIKLTVTHELCHAITHKGTRMENGHIVPGERYNKWIEIYGKYNLDQYSGQISDYASWHADEFLSEAFALYVGGYEIPDPVKVALEEYLKEVKR